jgi:putative Mg2+ transporter-C (MgtC) family protein
MGATDVDLFVKVLLAAGLGLVVGTERELSGQPAGIRTFTLVAMGSTLFTVVASSSFGGPGGDGASRIIANVLTGIGFLGGGLIVRGSQRIQGLTTAAGIWTVAAIGVAVGTNHYLVAILTSALVVLVFSARRLPLFARLAEREEP